MAARRRATRAVSTAAEPSLEPALERELAQLPPWLATRGEQLVDRTASGRLPHALLISGLSGVGKRAFARWFAEGLHCHQANAGTACGQCPSCAQHCALAHPDYRELVPEKAVIKVDDARELVSWLQLAAPAGGWRIALIDSADTMNRNAANCLLKTLEEPPERALVILVADRAARLPATIRSRCQELLISADDTALAQQWVAENASVELDEAHVLLARAAGAPCRAVSLADASVKAEEDLLAAAWEDLFGHRGSVGRIAGSLSELPVRRCLETLLRYTALALRARAGLPSGPDPAENERVASVAHCLENEQWFTIRDRIERLHRIDGPSFKTQTVLEGLLADIRLMLNHQGV